MKQLFCLRLNSALSLEEAWNQLEAVGIEILYGSEEAGHVEIFAHIEDPSLVAALPSVISCTPFDLPSIDWESQWALHGQDYRDGFVHVDLSRFDPLFPILRLQPGPGFGDLSHPTTRLVLELLADYLKGQTVVDIGCGSGVLAVCAAAMHASHVYGIDIDPQAIEHARCNAQLNRLEAHCSFGQPQEFEWQRCASPILVLMNMIQAEQSMAWNSLPQLHHQPSFWLTSGVRKEERSDYLRQTALRGWILEEEREEEGWLAFAFGQRLGKGEA